MTAGEYSDLFESDDISRSDVEDLLNTDKYLPQTNVEPEEGDFHNPAIEMYKHEHEWTSHGWSNISDTEILRKCPEYVPSSQAIEYLVSCSSILEIGSGNGYWSYVINRNGGNCRPTDIMPQDIPTSDLPDEYYDPHTDHSVDLGRPHYNEFPCVQQTQDGRRVIWEEVEFDSHTCVSDSEEDYVLLCHPVKSEWVEDLLDRIISTQKTLILVAQWEPGPDATPEFFRRLDRNWRLISDFPVINWSSTHSHGYVFDPPSER